MLALVAGLGALYALVLAAAPMRDFFDLELLSAGQWFLSMLRSPSASCWPARVAAPQIQRLEEPADSRPEPSEPAGARPTPRRRTSTDARAPGSAKGFRRTKIVATIGPATRRWRRLVELIEAGADVLRLNFSHGDAGEHASTIARPARPPRGGPRGRACSGTCPGPKLRLGDARAATSSSSKRAATLDADRRASRGDAERDAGLLVGAAGGRPRRTSRLPRRRRDPAAGPRAERRTRSSCEVEVGGAVSSHKGMNLPGADAALPAVGRDGPEVGRLRGRAGDRPARRLVRPPRRRPEPGRGADRRRGADIPLIAKIEKPQAAENAEEIIGAATGIMVARGDLGIELPLGQVPMMQKRLLALAGRLSKPSITATQMLASMVASPRPTRAEVTDVANAIYDGTDAVMLSEETAVGEHPIEAVRVMDRIARETEPDLPYGDWLFSRGEATQRRRRTRWPRAPSARSTASASPRWSSRRAAAAPRGSSPRTGPRVPVLAVSPRTETVRRMNILFGVALRAQRGMDEPPRPARRLRRARARERRRPVRRPDRDHRRPARAGARDEPVRGPPRSVGRAASGPKPEAAAARARGGRRSASPRAPRRRARSRGRDRCPTRASPGRRGERRAGAR